MVLQEQDRDSKAVCFVCACVCVLWPRSTTQVEMEYNSQRLTYKVLCVLEFNSDRKRMSIILK